MSEHGEALRSKEEKWVRTSDGWRTYKTIVLIRNRKQRFRSEWREENRTKPKNLGFIWRTNSPLVILPGYYARGPVFYFVTSTQDEADNVPSTITEAFQALKIRSTVKDPQKFGYVCKLLELLLKNGNLLELKYVAEETFLAISAVVEQVITREENLNAARHLVKLAKKHLYEFRDAYSSTHDIWNSRIKLVNDLHHRLRKFKIKKVYRASLKTPKLEELPDECLRLILHRFSDHRDICRLSQVNRRFNKLCNENLLWKDLSYFHFSGTKSIKQDVNIKKDWQKLYPSLIRKYPMREVYADMLELCSYCHYLFWKFSRHQCSYDTSHQPQKPPVYISITPQGFLHLFDT